MKQNILIVDNGGRGDAFAWKLRHSRQVGDIFMARGNGGARYHGYEQIQLDGVKQIPELAALAKDRNCLTLVTSDAPLAAGIVNHFTGKGLRIWGPSREAAQIEASKLFAKSLMGHNNIPTAPFEIAYDIAQAAQYALARFGRDTGAGSHVLKKSGLALGKGALVASMIGEALEFILKVMHRQELGPNGNEIVLEDWLPGPELSMHVFARHSSKHGVQFKIFPPSRDHKRELDGDKGGMTGGMGTISADNLVDDDTILKGGLIVRKTLEALAKSGAPFAGCLYPGFKITPQGLMVLEFNARPGDPETQSYLRRLKSDLLELILWSMGEIDEVTPEWDPRPAATVVVASGGYPNHYERNLLVEGIEHAEGDPDVVVFHACTMLDGDNRLVTSGGRVVGVSALGQDLKDAIDKATQGASKIRFGGSFYRSDIGQSTLKAMQAVS